MELPPLNEFSLWLEPTMEDYDRLSSFMNKLQKISGEVYFPPHVTLLGGLTLTQQEIESRMSMLSIKNSFKISFHNVSVGETPYKSFFLECSTSSELIELNKLAQKIYSTNTPYLPHMSLIYGNVEDDKNIELLQEVKENGLAFFSFEVNKVSLWHALGTPDNWKKIAESSLLMN